MASEQKGLRRFVSQAFLFLIHCKTALLLYSYIYCSVEVQMSLFTLLWIGAFFMEIIVLSVSQGLLFLLIVLSHKSLMKVIERKFTRQNQRLAFSKDRQLKIIKGIEFLAKVLKEKIIW